jgi:hypothetical protein
MRCLLLVVLVLPASCTKPGPACCLTRDDCASIGVTDDVRACTDGLACVDHACVAPDCASDGCSSSAPVCNADTGMCAACTSAADCDQFGSTDVCDAASGACVECVSSSDCDPAKPVCDSGACRGCQLDSECDSGACGDDGSCVPQADVIYISTGGGDVGVCERSAPCATLPYALSKATTPRNHIVYASGTYTTNQSAGIDSTLVQANSIVIHGGGARLSSSSAEGFWNIAIPTTIRDFDVTAHGPVIGAAGNPIVLERMTIHGDTVTIGVGAGAVTLRNVFTETNSTTFPNISLGTGANLTIDGAVIRGGKNCVADPAGGGVAVDLTNVLAYGASEAALNLGRSSGTLSFITVAASGANTSSGPTSVVCSSVMTVRSSIVWDPASSVTRPPIGGGCHLEFVIAGGGPVPGALNVDPVFADPASEDFHLAPTSPAIDMVDSGPVTDFDGDQRPQGARFDVGADEFKP